MVNRRTSLLWLGTAAGLSISSSALALEPEVPIRLQISLLDRVIPFDRNFARRVYEKLGVAVVVDESNVDSVRIGAQLLNELGARDKLGNYPCVVSRMVFSNAQRLADDCKLARSGVVCFTPGLRESTAKLSSALESLRVLTVGTLPEQVGQGLVLGSAVRSGKPRVLVNLQRAKLQEVDFRADFLRMAEVVG